MASSITRAVLDLARHVVGHDITPRNNTTKAALDAFLDEVAGHDVDTRGMGVPEIIDTITANYSGGGGGGGTVEVIIIEDYNEQALTTAYFTAKNSAGESITPVLHEEQDEGGSFYYFTIAVDAGSVITLESIADSGYNFYADNTVYMLDMQEGGAVLAPITASSSSVKFVAVSDATYPLARMILALDGTH